MQPSALYPIIGQKNHGLAATLEQVMFYCRRAGGECEIRLAHMERFVGRKRSSISRYLRWLADQGFISIREEVRNNIYKILYVRCNIRLRHQSGTSDGTSMAPNTQEDTQGPNTQEDTRGRSPERVGPPEASKMLNGKLDQVPGRLKQKQEVARAHAHAKAPTPRKAAMLWVRLLGQYGYRTFDPDDGKHLKHIAKTIQLFECRTLGDFEIELDRRITFWNSARPKNLKKAPPHPWAINRTDVLFQKISTAEAEGVEATLPVKQPIYQPPKVDKSSSVPAKETEKEYSMSFKAAMKAKGKLK